jgi:hypothetical protein
MIAAVLLVLAFIGAAFWVETHFSKVRRQVWEQLDALDDALEALRTLND